MRLLSSIGLVFMLLAAAGGASAQAPREYPRPYDGFQAGEDAARYQNDRRLLALNRQLETVDYYRAWAGVSRYQGFGLWRQDVPVAPWAYPADPYGAYDPYGYGLADPWLGPSLYAQPYPATDTVRQPVGQIQVQTGPNRWESHPVYESPPGSGPPPMAYPATPLERPRSREF